MKYGALARVLLTAAAALLLAACSADKPKPTPLQSFAPKIAGKLVWQARVDDIDFPLLVSVRDGNFIVAGGDGVVRALRAEDGQEMWRADAHERLSAGVGSDGRFVSVATRGNEVVTFDHGKELWRRRLLSRVVTAPFVAGERVFVMSIDRTVQAFDALDGRHLWTMQRPGDALTLLQAGVITSYRNSLLVGQGVRLVSLDPLHGTLQWEVALASPRGTNEVERLADLLGPALRLGDKVCARAFQSAVACVDATRGALLWTRNVGGVDAVGGNNKAVFGADASDRITAWNADTGDVLWTNESLRFRGLSGALAIGPTVVFGDAEGYVHFLSTSTGELQLRLEADSSGVVGTPVAAGNTVLVSTRKGGLYAFRPN